LSTGCRQAEKKVAPGTDLAFGRCNQRLDVQGLRHFGQDVMLGLLAYPAFLKFSHNALDFTLVDLSVRLGGIDHGFQHDL